VFVCLTRLVLSMSMSMWYGIDMLQIESEEVVVRKMVIRYVDSW